MFLSLKQILPDTVHNESLVNCEAYTGAASLGRFGVPQNQVFRLYSQYSSPNFFSRTFASWRALRIWMGINTHQRNPQLGQLQNENQSENHYLVEHINWIANFGIKAPCN